MKKILLFVIIALVVVAASVTIINVGATDTEAVTVMESDTEVVDAPALIDRETAEVIVDIIENSDSKESAIISIAEKLGVTTEEAENILDAIIAVGDEYLGETEWWVGFKNDVQQDIQFWTTAIVLICAVLAIVGGVFVLLAKTNPTMKKAMWGMAESLKINDQIKNENSQTLGELKDLFAAAVEREKAFEKLIDEKEDQIALLTEKIATYEERSEEERLHMVSAEIYTLRMLKLALDRTAMPLADKAIIDLFYAKGLDAMTAGLSAEDVEKIEKTMATLDTVGDQV